MATLRGASLNIPECTLFELFMGHVHTENIHKVVLISDNRKYTLESMLAISNNISTELLRKFCQFKIHAPQIVALMMLPSVDWATAILALLKTGNAFISLDPTLPTNRIRYILKDSQVKFVITHRHQQNLNDLQDLNIEILDTSTFGEIPNSGSMNLPYSMPQNPLVTVLYTSGSTGKPKPVRLYTNNLLNRLVWYWKEFPFTPEEVCCSKTSVLFVDSLTELLAPLLKAVPILVLDQNDVVNTETFLELIHKWKVTRLVLVPSQLQAILAMRDLNPQEGYLEHLKLVISAGEELPHYLARSFLQATQASQCILCNFYGCTETTGDVTFVKLSSPADVEALTVRGHLSIGKPLFNSQVYLKNISTENGQEIGEIVATGENIASLMGTSTDEGHVFPTGDLGFIEDGLLYYIGRKDSVVKIRGHRVDLKEIETVVQESSEQVLKVVALSCGTGSEMQLTAFYQTKRSTDKLKVEKQIMRACKENLPCYMVPRIHHLDNIPLQDHTKKIDRRALRNMLEEENAQWRTHPDSIMDSLAKILHIPLNQFDEKKTFFELGGNSLSAVLALVHLSKMNHKISLGDFLAAGSIQEVMDKLHEKPLVDGALPFAVLKELKDGYSFEGFQQEHVKAAIKLISCEYATNNPLSKLLKSSEESIMQRVISHIPVILADGLSFVVRNNQNQEIVACSLNLDAATDVSHLYHEEEAILAVHEAAKAPVQEEIRNGPWVAGFMAAVISSMPADIKLNLLQMMEGEVLRSAKALGYRGIVAINSHPVTMVSSLS